MSRRAAGFSTVEVLVATALALVVIGSLFTLATPAEHASVVGPEAMDMQQRARVGADALSADLALAGAGLDAGPAAGPLNTFFAPVLPRRTGLQSADSPSTARSDAVTIFTVPLTSSQTTLAAALAASAAPNATLAAASGCPIGQPACGLGKGDGLLVFDTLGDFDTFDVTSVNGASVGLQHHASGAGAAYAAGAYAATVATRVYYFDSTNHQLRLYDGYQSDTPLIDNVVGVTFSYLGDPAPPVRPQPPVGASNCLFDADGAARPMATLAAEGGSLAPLPLAILSDGPWCGAGGNVYDADLLRVRRVRVSVRVQTSLASLRGTPSRFFVNPGTSRDGTLWLPDYTLTFDVTPRNMNAGR